MKPLILGYSPWSSPDNCHPFNNVFSECISLQDAPVNECDAIVLWGGTDINPKFYGQEPHTLTYHHEHSTRDKLEWMWLHSAMLQGVPVIGVCRGAQLICAGVGGTLFQHVTGHQSTHAIETKDGKGLPGRVYQSSSAHHQMLNLLNLPTEDYEVLAWSKNNRSKQYEDSTGVVVVPEGFKEPEIVLFPKVKALAVQGHPEWQDLHDPFNQYVLELVQELVGKEVAA